MSGSVQVLYFAWLRERTGCAQERVEVPETVRTVGDLIALLRARSPGHESAFMHGRVIRAAVNQDIAGPETPVSAGDEIAFFPPMTGG